MASEYIRCKLYKLFGVVVLQRKSTNIILMIIYGTWRLNHIILCMHNTSSWHRFSSLPGEDRLRIVPSNKVYFVSTVLVKISAVLLLLN